MRLFFLLDSFQGLILLIKNGISSQDVGAIYYLAGFLTMLAYVGCTSKSSEESALPAAKCHGRNSKSVWESVQNISTVASLKVPFSR